MEHKAQTHFEGLLRVSLLESSRERDELMYLARAMCVTLLWPCTFRYIAIMPRSRPPHIVRYTIRVNRAQAERVATLKARLNARSDNEVFDYLITVGTNQRDDLGAC